MTPHALSIAVTVIALVCAGSSASATPRTQPGGDEDLSLIVQRFMLKKCGECHGSHLADPDGDFGFLDDLRRLADDEDYIVREDPEASILFESVTLEPDDPDFMPPSDAEEAPLTRTEVEQLRAWIESGAMVSDAAQALMGAGGQLGGTDGPEHASLPDLDRAILQLLDDIQTEARDEAEDSAAPEEEKTLGERWRRFIGQFHTASTHLPVGLIFAAFLAEILARLFHRERLQYVACFCLFFGALGAIGSAASGWFHEDGETYRSYYDAPGAPFEKLENRMDTKANDLHWHRWLGVATAGLALLTWILSLSIARVHDQTDGARGKSLLLFYWLALLLLTALMGVVGFLGGVLVHGAGKYHPL